MIWYWYNAQKCQTRSTNTIAFSWENLKLYWSSLWKVPIKSSELLNISTKLKNSEFAPRIQNHFLGNARQSLKLCKKFFPILGLLINFFWSLKVLKRIFWVIEYCYKAKKMPNLLGEYKTIFRGKRSKPWNFKQVLNKLPILESPVILIWSLSRA